MADIYTKIADVFQSESFKDYTNEQIVEKNAFIKSGIMKRDAQFDALIQDRSMIVNMPFWKQLTGDSEVLSDTTPLSVNALNSEEQIAVQLLRGKVFGYSDLAAMASGSDPEKKIGDGIADYWNTEIQKVLISELKGLFTTGGALEDNMLDGSADVIDGDMIIDAESKLGDHYDVLKGMVMHSAVYQKLRKLQLIDTVQDAINPAATFESYQGKRIIVDDSVPHSGGVYDTYLFGEGAFAYGSGKASHNPEYEMLRNELAGTSAVISRRAFLVHPYGTKFTKQGITSTTTPSNTDLANSANWERAFELKNIPMVCLKSKVSE